MSTSWFTVESPGTNSDLFPYLTFPYERSRSIQGHHLNDLGITRVPDAAYQVSRAKAVGQLVLLKIFQGYHIWAWPPSRLCDPDHLDNMFISKLPRAFIWHLTQQLLRKKNIFEI